MTKRSHKDTSRGMPSKDKTIQSQSREVPITSKLKDLENKRAEIDIYNLPQASPPPKRQKVSERILQPSSIKSIRKDFNHLELVLPASVQPIPSSQQRRNTASATLKITSKQTSTPQLAQTTLFKTPLIAWDKSGPKNQGSLLFNSEKSISNTKQLSEWARVVSPAPSSKNESPRFAGSQTIVDENGSPIPSQDQDQTKSKSLRHRKKVNQSLKSNSKAKPVPVPVLGSPIFFKAQNVTNGNSRQETYLAGEKSLVNQQSCLGDPFKRSTHSIPPTPFLQKLKAQTASQNDEKFDSIPVPELEILESPSHQPISSSTPTTVSSQESEIENTAVGQISDEWCLSIQAYHRTFLETLSLIAQVLCNVHLKITLSSSIGTSSISHEQGGGTR
jgi:hypothetical protein